MQAIFPISMVVAILAAIGIIFLLPSLIFRMNVNIPEVQPFGHTLVSNRGGTGAIPSFRQGNTQNTPNRIAQLVVSGNSAQQGDAPSKEVVAIVGQDGSVEEVVVIDPLELKKQEFEYELARRAGYVRRRPSRKQRRSRRRGN